MSLHANDFAPMTFVETLRRLDSWKGRRVRVESYSEASGDAGSETMMVIEGVLGEAQVAGDAIDPRVRSAAGYAVGAIPPNGFYVSAGDHQATLPLGRGDAMRIDFRRGYSIQVRPLE
jgi:hypothetical protein